MEKEGRNHYRMRGRNTTTNGVSAASPDLLLNWGNRKRLRCVKLQHKDDVDGQKPEAAVAATATTKTCRVDRRSSRSEKESGNDVLQRIASPTRRVLRNSEATATMTATTRANGGNRGAPVTSPERGRAGGGATPSEEKKSGAGVTSSGSEGTVWPKFEIALTTKEKEEDFLAFKGSKLPQRPKKRAKVVQKTLNLVSPGAWLCDLTLERYEVREKKTSKKKPRGLKAMGNMESDSE